MDGVVPLAMEFVTGDAEAGHLLIGYDNSLWIGASVEFAADGKPGLCCGGADEIDDHTIADQRLRLPVHRDEREQAVLHLVPFARTRRQVVNGDVDAQLVGKTLEFKLPQPHARAIAAAAIGGDGQPGGAGIAQTTNLLPPAADRLNRERRRVAAHANAHPAGIGCEIVDAIRHRPAEFLDQEVMHPDLLRVTLRTPVPTGVLEVSDQLFFLSVDRDHRLARRQCGPHALLEMSELRIAVWVALPLARLAVALQAELLLVQQLTNQGAADTVAHGGQGLRQLRQALAGPAQRRHRIAARVRLDQRQQIAKQRGILRHPLLAAATGTADTARVKHLRCHQFLQAPADCAGSNSGGPRQCRDAAIAGCLGFRRREHPPATLVQVLRRRGVAFANRGDLDHQSAIRNHKAYGSREDPIPTHARFAYLRKALSVLLVEPPLSPASPKTLPAFEYRRAAVTDRKLGPAWLLFGSRQSVEARHLPAGTSRSAQRPMHGVRRSGPRRSSTSRIALGRTSAPRGRSSWPASSGNDVRKS